MSAFALQAHQQPRRRQRRWSRAAGFTYGNGLIHNRTLNARGLPYQIRDRNGGASLLNYTYSYDAHGNLTGLTDTTLPGPWIESRSLAYDARDRMTLATAPGILVRKSTTTMYWTMSVAWPCTPTAVVAAR